MKCSLLRILTNIFYINTGCRKATNRTGNTTWVEGIETVSPEDIPEMGVDWIWVWLTNACSCLVCYFFARSTAKMLIQSICYAIPLFICTLCCSEWWSEGANFGTIILARSSPMNCPDISSIDVTKLTLSAKYSSINSGIFFQSGGSHSSGLAGISGFQSQKGWRKLTSMKLNNCTIIMYKYHYCNLGSTFCDGSCMM